MNFTSTNRFKTGNAAQRRGFAATRWPEQASDFAFFKGEIEINKGRLFTMIVAQVLQSQ